jgi:hypothetical protein
MFDELAASLVCRSPGALIGCPSTPTVASVEVEAALADARSPPWMIQLSFAEVEAAGVVVEPSPVQVDVPSNHGADGDGSAMPAVDGGTPHTAAATSIQESLEERLCLPLQTPLIRGPPRLRRPRTPASAMTLQRSVRIATAPREADFTRQAQCVLMRKLGVVAPLPNVDSETVRKCKATLRVPLPDHTLESLELLLGAEFDPVA